MGELEAGAIGLIIADDHVVVREGIAALVERGGCRVMGEAGDGRAALDLARRLDPDVILMDLHMPLMGGAEATRLLRTHGVRARVIVLTTFDGDDDIYNAIDAGAVGFLLKTAPRAELLDAIRAVHAGLRWIQPDVAERLKTRVSADVLTARELDVLRQMGSGMSNKEIAAVLAISEGTVKTHVKAVLAKLGAHDRTQAVIIAGKRGLFRDM
jgi:two-component system, NarL family, response regulator